MPNFLLEVGTEELPASFVADAIGQWKHLVSTSLLDQFLSSYSIEIYGTPRRLAVLIRNLPAQQSDREEEIKGPPAQSAFKDGQPTKAAEGFARKFGVNVADFEIRPTDKGDFVFVRQKIQGRATAEILTELVPNWISKLQGKRLMRWGDGDIKFPRPIRWLVTLWDGEILPIELVNGSETIKSDRITQGHRVLHPEPITLKEAGEYVETLKQASVLVNSELRGQKIADAVTLEAQKLGGQASITSELFEEVTDLVEFPNAVVGKFDEEFLNLPSEVITTVMISHQRYFPVWTEGYQQLLPYFITISNGDPTKKEIIARGNERVIRARLADGKFFFNADLAKPLETYLPLLEKVTFQADLGTVRAKVERIRKIAALVGAQLNLSEEETAHIDRAALLCKADLVTQMVGEFPELQGIMGEKYARASGEPELVAQAISDHYLPKGSDDNLPQSIVGQVVAIADRLDTLVCIFGLGMLPTGSSDPFALRRAANGVINIVWNKQLGLNLNQLLKQVIDHFVQTFGKQETADTLLSQLQEFFLQRIRSLLDEKGINYDLINAVVGEDDAEYSERALTNLLDVWARADFLRNIRNNGQLDAIYETVNRSTRLAKQGDLDTKTLEPGNLINPALFEKSSEQTFLDAINQLVPQTQTAQKERNYQQLVDALSQIAPTVSTFFDGENSVLVMDENLDIRRNRLNLLGLLRNHARVLADFGAIVKS